MIQYLIRTTSDDTKLNIMYDIACNLKRHLEVGV